MPVEIRRRGDVTILDFTGSFAEQDARQLHEQAVATVSSAAPKILMNLGGVTSMDWLFAGHLSRAYGLYTDNGATVKLAAVPPQVREELDINGLAAVVEIYDTEDKAIKSFA